MPMPPYKLPKGRQAPRDAGEDGVSSAGSYIGGGPAAERVEAPPLMLVPAPTVKKSKIKAPQESIDEFWAKFSSKNPGKAITVLPKDVWAKEAGEKVPRGIQTGHNAVASYEEAAKICKEKVAQIVRECRRVNQKYRDQHFDIDFDLKWGNADCLEMLSSQKEDEGNDDDTFDFFDFGKLRPGSVKRVGDVFENPKFYVGGANANDVRQGRDGDCWFLAALCTLANKPDLIDRVCVARDEQVGVYGFVFHRDGEWISEIIDDKLYLTKPDYDESWIERNLMEDRQRINSEEEYRKIYQTNSGALWFSQCEDPNETWLPLLEKAYAKAHGDYAAIEGGFTGEALEDLTGGVTTEIFSTDILDKDYFWKEELLKVNSEFLFGCYTGIFGGRGDRKGIVEGHAYSVMKAVEIDGKRLCMLRNPWGNTEWNGAWSDGSKEWTAEWIQKLDHTFGDDGAFWISYEDLLRKYQVFDRTRLFSEDWKATSQWVSLNVPWTVDYHDTKFTFTLEKKAQVVLVLSQLDQRYFCGLEGQYRFKLSFRVHKAGEADYIVRSHGNYWMRRSVTAELELDAGEYDVLLRVETTKIDDILPVEDVVRNNVKSRPEKLLRIGLSYDLAHAKGQDPYAKEDKKKTDLAQLEKEKKETKEKLMKEKQKRIHNENKERRKELAAKEKRKAKAKAKAEKKKAEAEKKAQEEKKAEEEKKPEEKKEEGAAESKSDDKDAAKEAESKPAEEGVVAKEDEKKSSEAESGTAKVTEVESVKTDKADEPKPAETVAADKEAPAEAEKSDAPGKPDESTAAATNEEPNPSPPNDVANDVVDPPTLDDDDSDDDSDIVSNISDITNGVIEDAVEEARLLAKGLIPDIPVDEEPDEFESDPWNAVSIVGLRVYCKDSGVTVKVVRPRDKDQEKEETPAELKLDVDSSAADATK